MAERDPAEKASRARESKRAWAIVEADDPRAAAAAALVEDGEKDGTLPYTRADALVIEARVAVLIDTISAQTRRAKGVEAALAARLQRLEEALAHLHRKGKKGISR